MKFSRFPESSPRKDPSMLACLERYGTLITALQPVLFKVASPTASNLSLPRQDTPALWHLSAHLIATGCPEGMGLSPQ